MIKCSYQYKVSTLKGRYIYIYIYIYIFQNIVLSILHSTISQYAESDPKDKLLPFSAIGSLKMSLQYAADKKVFCNKLFVKPSAHLQCTILVRTSQVNYICIVKEMEREGKDV